MVISAVIVIDLNSETGTDMFDYVRGCSLLVKISILLTCRCPWSIRSELDAPHDIFIGGAALDAGALRAMATRSPPDWIGLTAVPSDSDAPGNSGERWPEMIATADRIIVSSEQARMFALKY